LSSSLPDPRRADTLFAEEARRIFLGAYRSDRIEAEASGAALGRGHTETARFLQRHEKNRAAAL